LRSTIAKGSMIGEARSKCAPNIGINAPPNPAIGCLTPKSGHFEKRDLFHFEKALEISVNNRPPGGSFLTILGDALLGRGCFSKCRRCGRYRNCNPLETILAPLATSQPDRSMIGDYGVRVYCPAVKKFTRFSDGAEFASGIHGLSRHPLKQYRHRVDCGST